MPEVVEYRIFPLQIVSPFVLIGDRNSRQLGGAARYPARYSSTSAV